MRAVVFFVDIYAYNLPKTLKQLLMYADTLEFDT